MRAHDALTANRILIQFGLIFFVEPWTVAVFSPSALMSFESSATANCLDVK